MLVRFIDSLYSVKIITVWCLESFVLLSLLCKIAAVRDGGGQNSSVEPPPPQFGLEYKQRSDMCVQVFHHTDLKDPDSCPRKVNASKRNAQECTIHRVRK